MYPKSAAPQYVPGGSANAVICLLVGVLALVLRWVHVRENSKLEARERGEGRGGEAIGQRAAGFRYIY